MMGREEYIKRDAAWMQLTAAVLELRQHVQALETEVEFLKRKLENPIKADALIRLEMEHSEVHG